MRSKILKLMEVNINQPLTLERILTTFAVTLLLALLIIVVYRVSFKGVLYNHSFPISLLMVSIVTALIIMPISSNIVLSLGMVGALSIVRFRTAIKDPLDIGYMFWAISVGLTAGAGFFQLALIGTLVLALIMLSTAAISGNGYKKSYLLILRYDDSFKADLKPFLPRYRLKSKTSTSQGYEAVFEIRLSNQATRIVEQLQHKEGVQSVSLVRFSGDYPA